MNDPLYIYIHGFNSSPQSYKARVFVEHMEARGLAHCVQVPHLPHWPARAIAQLEALIESAFAPAIQTATAPPQPRDVVLLGSSLGGYYATYLVERFAAQGGGGLRAVLINPAVRPYELLSAWLGNNQNLYTAERYRLTERHLDQLLALDCARLSDPQRYLLLTQTGDETLDYRQAVEKFADSPQWVQPGGSHGFDHFEQVIPAILAFGRGALGEADLSIAMEEF